MSLFYSRALLFFSGIRLSFCLILLKLKTRIFIELSIFSIRSVRFVFPLIIDWIRLIFIRVVLLISGNVLHFSNLYIEDEVYIKRLTHLVLLFIRSIRALIFIPNIIALLLGWDGLGLVSLLLVTFYASPKALGAGVLTALSNRIGDAFILVSLSIIYEFNYYFGVIRLEGQPIASLCVILAAITKRAQFPLSSWLPAAIEAPTPVSALVHSSTLVTAGVYLIIRLYPLLRNRKFFNYTILCIGAITSLLAGIRAIVEFDLKKVIALSTLSQLGLIIISIGLGYPGLAFFHLLTHAILKALLLVCAGCLIHFHGHAQDIRQIGGVRSQLPVVRTAMSISSLALCAVPFMAGFYSKDAILECLFLSPFRFVVVFVAIFSTIFTGMYSARLFMGGVVSHSKSSPCSRLKEPIISPIMNLGIGALLGGSVLMSFVGPFCLEPFRPYIKRLFSCILVMAPLFAIFRGGLKALINIKKIRVSYYKSGRRMFSLTPTTTQFTIESGSSPSRDFCYSDQSWLEGGHFIEVKAGSSFFINLIVARGLIFFITYFVLA